MSDENEDPHVEKETVDKTEKSDDELLKEEIRKFTVNVFDSSVSNQDLVYVAVTKAVNRVSELPEPVIKGLVKLALTASTKRYSQRASFQLVSRLLDALAKHDSAATVRHLAQTVIALFPTISNVSVHTANLVILPAKWLLKFINSSAPEDLNVVVSALGTISYHVSFSKKAASVFERKLSTWKIPDNLNSTVATLAKEPANQENVLCLISFLTKVFSVDMATVALDLYTKACLLCKTRPAPSVLECIRNLFVRLEEKAFSDSLVPNMKKALLRSPEIAMFGVRVAIESLPFCLDSIADDLSKGVSASALSADGELREEAVAVIVALAHKCSASSISKLLNKLFDQIAAAKSAEQRVSLFNGIASCASTSASGADIDKICNDVITKTAKADKETNEATVSAQWSAAGAWAVKLSASSPALVAMFKEASKLAPSVRFIGYGEIARTVVKRKMTSLPEGCESVFSDEIESAQKDALDAIGLSLAIISTAPIGSEMHLKSLAKMSTNENVFKDKTLSSMKTNQAVLWAELLEKIFLERADKSNYAPLTLQSLVLLLFWPQWEVRKRALLTVTNVIEAEGAFFAQAVADTVYSETVTGNLQQLVCKIHQGDGNIHGETYVQVLQRLLTAHGNGLEQLAVHSLLLGSLPQLVEIDGSVWLRWIHGLERTTWENNNDFHKAAIERVLSCEQRPVRDNAFITLVSLGVSKITNALWEHVEKRMSTLEIRAYTRITEKEVAIYRTPDGQLYNMDALDFDEGEHAANLKRENKAYSYKEQLQEMQLRRELAEKKKKEGKLTTKQKQVMDKELAAEKVIREEITRLFNEAEACLDEARALVTADHHGAFLRSSILFNCCLPLTRSHLVCSEAAHLFLAYRDSAFPHSDDYLGEVLGSCWLRVIGSKWVDPIWSQENLEDALKRTFSLLNERAFVVDTGDEDFQDDAMLFDEIVGAPQLTLLFPFIKTILNGAFIDVLKTEVLNLLQSAIHKRFLKDQAVLQLPMLEFADLLLSYFSETLAAPCLQSLVQLVGLANDSEDTGDRVVAMVRGALSYLQNENSDVRENVIKMLSAPQLITRLVLSSGNDSFVVNCLVRLYVACHDGVESVADAANRLWYASLLHLRDSMGYPLVDECVSPVGFIRDSASRALSSFVQEFPQEVSSLLKKIDETYRDLCEVRGAVFDEVGRMQKDVVDEWERRSGIGAALVQLAHLVEAADAEQFIKIVVPDALNDRCAACRESMCSAAVEVIRRHGNSIMPVVLPFFEGMSDKTPAGAEFDNLRQGLVVLIGTLAQYLEPSSGKVKAIVSRLLEVLNTPSQSVQESVARCLPPLVPAIRSECKMIMQRLQVLLMNADTYGERRGAAYGIAGLMKGLGMHSLKEYDIMPMIQKSLADKKNWKYREGGLLALEIMCSTVGKLFEPYMIQALPALLLCFGDNDENVRKAAEDTARAMMSSMSAHGTKLILPTLTTALDDDSWRTKCAATELLGSMAFCAPRQLSACLPSIVPKLIEVLADSSSKVQKSGEKALRQIARVVRNPEIIGVTNHIMIGLLDPANKTNVALQAVLNTKFIHYIDAPSLALLMPIVRRAFEDRNSETRRCAAQIIANIYSLTEHKDMEPYLADLVPGVQKSLLDPVPEIRTVSARALGAIIAKSSGGTSEKLRDSIVPWLKDKLVSPQSTVDRSGAAQGLCEVLAGVGTEQLDFVMPEIIAVTESSDVSAETRDGYILMYIYLPMTFGEKFVPYLPKVVPPILKALADENEYVRASALKAGQRLIAQYCNHARRLLLPQLQDALMDDNWRIRHAAVQLIGDFLFTISGVTGKSTTSTANEDDTMGMEQAGKTITRALGQQCRDKVIAGLYLARSDVALIVRQAAGHVWKIVVANTPRTLKEVMKTLFEMVVDSLASSCEERQQMGARCLGELVRKMGDKIINEILPVLELNQKSEDVEKRVGVAVALHEIIDNMTRDVLNHYLSILVPPVRSAICDDDPAVRSAAADTFSVLYQNVGHDALDEIITPLLEKLTPEQDHILEGLCEVMKQNSRQMLPYLLPRLTKPPINVHALCSLASVAGDSLSRQLPRVLDALLAACTTNDQYDPMIDSCEKVVIAVADEDGIPVLTDYLLQSAAKGNVPAAVLLHTFVDKSGAVLTELNESLMTGLLQLYASENPQIVDHAINTAIAVAKEMDQRELQEIMASVKKTLNIMVSQAKGRQIPGFAHPKALQPLLNMLRESILQGGVEIKALAGETLGMVVGIADPVALKAHVVNITGPLIRVLGDRYPANVKLSILDTLSRLLDKVDAMLRPFLPQLQSTFLKALQEPSSRAVRLSAAGALSRLLKIHPKPEPLVLELFKFIANSQDQALTETTLVAARALVSGCCKKLSASTIEEGYRVCESIYAETLENASELDNSLTQCSGALVGELIIGTEDFSAQNIFKDVESSTKPRVRQAKAFALQQMCYKNASTVWSEAYEPCRSALAAAFSADPITACAAVRAAGYVLISQEGSPDRDLLVSVSRSVNHQSIDVRRTTASILGQVAAKAPSALPNDMLKLFVPQLVNGCKESNSSVRSAAELGLVYAFHIQDGQEVFDSYRNSVEGAAKTVLDEVHVALRRVIKHGDIALEPMYNLVSV